MNNTLILRNTSFYNDSISPTDLNVNYTINGEQSILTYSEETSVPLNILRHNSSLQAIVVYLKEILDLKYSEISNLLNRDQRTIWVTYINAKKKKISLNVDDDSSPETALQIDLPLSIFASRTFSMLETIVFYLKNNQNLSFKQISELLGKKYRTIWTVYKRAIKKLDNEK